jgi:predicted DNA-binding antitoxin AbrB/MazE fold protein
MAAIRVIYRNGQLHPLEPLQLDEGQELRIQILDTAAEEALLVAVADLLVQYPVPAEVVDEEALQRLLDAAFADTPPASEIIIDARHQDG